MFARVKPLFITLHYDNIFKAQRKQRELEICLNVKIKINKYLLHFGILFIKT
jgi:hypothetical protein